MEEPMKLRHPWLIKMAARLGAWAARLWMNTLRFSYCPIGLNVHPQREDLSARYLYAFWHETLLLPTFRYSVRGCQVLISRSHDGALIAEICHCLGYRPVRGSTSRGGIEAVREIMNADPRVHVGVTPDGPRGPRRRVQPGIIYLASKTGMPIIPIAFASDRPWRLKSWDRFAIPRPWSRATCVTLPEIVVPPDIDREQMERYRVQVETDLLLATDLAEQWAETGARPQPLPLAA